MSKTSWQEMAVYLNGEIVSGSEAKVSVFDHGFLYGDGVFEGIRVYDGCIFKCKEHIDRIYRSAAVRASFKNAGTQLLWYGIGNLEPENEKVSQQRVDTWAADWNGKASVVRASGEAALEVAREKARAQAQAEILKGIAKSLGDITAAGADQDRNIKEVFLFRLAQVLETIKDNRRGLPSGEQ